MDSDGDGKSNGEELGDPHCLFSTKWKSAHVVAPTGHPGEDSSSSYLKRVTRKQTLRFL